MPGKRWMATIRYRDGTKPLFIEFEKIMDLHDSVEQSEFDRAYHRHAQPLVHQSPLVHQCWEIIKILRGRLEGSPLPAWATSSSPCSVAPALGVRGMRGDPAPLAQPYLVPTRDWGVVVDTAA